MQKFLAMLMSFILIFIGTLFPGVGGNDIDTYTQAQWLEIVAGEFKLSANLEDGDNYFSAERVAPQTLTANQVTAIEACYDWEVILKDEAIDYDKKITNMFVGITLVRVTKLDAEPAFIVNGNKIENAEVIAIAVSLGFVQLELTGKFKVNTMTKDSALAALHTAKELADNKSFGKPTGEMVANGADVDLAGNYEMVGEQGALQMQAADGTIIADDSTEISKVDFSGNFNPFAKEANGISAIEEQGLLEKIKLSFSIGGVKIKVDPTDTGIDLSVGGSINGIGIEKAYELSNFDVAASFDGDLKEKTINHAYLAVNYDLKDITKITASYATSLADSKPEDTSTDFFAKVQSGVYAFKSGGDNVIDVFSVAVAVPNCPAITFNLQLKVIITFDGKVEIVVNSHESKGYEIVNNKFRAIANDCDPDKTTVDILANVKVLIGLNLSVRIVNITLLDVEIRAGLGVRVEVVLTGGASAYKYDIPVDFLFDIAFAYPNAKDTTVTANIKMYGVVEFSVGQNSPILKKLGLKKTWTLVDEGNGTFVDITINEAGTVVNNLKTA